MKYIDRIITFFAPKDKLTDTYKDAFNRGIWERYNRVVGDSIDFEFIQLIDNVVANNIDPFTIMDKYVPVNSADLGFTLSTFDGSTEEGRKRMLKLVISWYKKKGTLFLLEVLYGRIGIDITIVEHFSTGGFDSPVTFDDEFRRFDSSECETCTDYSVLATGDLDFPIPVDIQNYLRAVTDWNEPIDAVLRIITYNGVPLSFGTLGISFTTDALAVGQLFDPSVTKAVGDPVSWLLGDGTLLVGNSISHIYALAGLKTVVVDFADPENITGLNMSNDRIVGTIDLSNTNVLDTINLSSNVGLTSIVHSQNSTPVNSYLVNNCSLTGILDLSTLSGIGGVIRFDNNLPLTEVLLPPSSAVDINTFRLHGCGLTGTLDLSMLTKLGGIVYLYSNPLLENIILPTSTVLINQLSIYVTNITTLDMTGLNLITRIFLHSNPLLTSLIFPDTPDNAITWIRTDQCPSLLNLDLSPLHKLGGNIDIGDGALTNLILPVSPQQISSFSTINSPNLLAIDATGMTGMGGSINISDCTSLATVVFGVTTFNISGFVAFNCNFSTLDLTPFTGGMTSVIRVENCTLLTSLTFPATPINASDLYTFGCSMATLDLSTFVSAKFFELHDNPSLISVVMPINITVPCLKFKADNCNLIDVDFTTWSVATDVNNCSFILDNNSMNVSGVNKTLAILDGISVGGFTGRLITIAGTNDAPDGFAGGFDGSAAKTSLIAKGFTVTTN